MRMPLRFAAMALCGALLLFACSPSEDSPRRVEPPEPPSTLALVTKTVLRTFELGTGELARVADLPSTRVALTTDGELWAAVQEGDSSTRRRGGFKAPQIVTARMDGTGQREVLGAGNDPTWAPDDQHVAAVLTIPGYLICPSDANVKKAEKRPRSQGCVEGERVVVYDSATPGEPEIAVGAGTWDIVGWVDEDHVAARSRHDTVVRIGFPGATDEEQILTPFTSDAIWAVSPEGFKIFGLIDGGAVIWDRPSETTVSVGVQRNIGATSWSPDGGTIAAVVSGVIVTIDADSGETATVPDQFDARGPIVWSPNSGYFAFMSGATTAVVCALEDLACDRHELPRGSKLLALF